MMGGDSEHNILRNSISHGYPWYIPEINFGYVPEAQAEGSCCGSDELHVDGIA